MSETVEFLLKMRDTMSGMWPNIAAKAGSAFSGINASINSTQNNMEKLSRPIKMHVDTTAIDRVNGKLQALSNFQIAGGVAVGNLASSGITGGAHALLNQAMDVKRLGFEAGANRAQFEVLAGQGQGTALYKELTKYVQDSIFGPELYKDARTMMAFGVAVKDVMPDMKMLGDISLGNAERMQALTLAFSQTTAAGKLMGQDLLQYVNAGFNPLQVMVERWQQFGFKQKVTLEQLRDLTSEGKISSAMVKHAFEVATSEGYRFHDMLNKMAQTPFGMEQAMLGSFEGAKQGLGDSLSPEFKNMLLEIKPMIDELPKTFDDMRPKIAGVINDFASLVRWTRTNSEAIGNWLGVLKVGAEAFIIWKVATVGMTGANWLWVQSMSAMAPAAATLTQELAVENTMLEEQTLIVKGLQTQWANLDAWEKKAMLTAAEGSFALPLNTRAAALANGQALSRSANTAALGMAGGAMAAASEVAIPVAIWSIASNVMGELAPKGLAGERFSLFNSQTDWMEYFASAIVKHQLDVRSGKTENMFNRLSHANGEALWNKLHATVAAVKQEKTLGQSMTGVSDSVIGGGARQVNLNFKNIVETINNNPNNKGEAIKMTEQDLKEVLYKVFAGLQK
jgi:tape measure domain-containing protein